MQRIHDLNKWARLDEGTEWNLGQTAKVRRVKLEVNSPGEVLLYLALERGNASESRFLARVVGRDTIEFVTPADVDACSVLAEGGTCFIYTSDGREQARVVDGAVSFTRLVERKPRDRTQELIEYNMQRNFQRIIDAQAGELRRATAERVEAEQALTQAARDALSAGSQQSSADKGGASAKAVAKSDGGGKGASGDAADS